MHIVKNPDSAVICKSKNAILFSKERQMFSEEVKSILPSCIEWRRTLHMYPELSFEEERTTDFLIGKMKEIPGIRMEKPCKTGVVAILKGSGTGRTIALRADIDALPIEEKTDLQFASKTSGVMHACGHDGHTAMQLAALSILAGNRDKLKGEARFIFQHAEELPPGGAAELEEKGVMKGVDEVYGLHLSSLFPTGAFGVRAGALTSATDRFDIKVIGKGGHSAYPESCVDPVVIAAEIISALQTIVSRSIKAVEPAVVSVCMINGGSAYNIIPGTVTITGSTRTFSKETRDKLPETIRRISESIAAAHGGSIEFSFSYGYASVMNDKALTANSRKLIEEAFGKDAVLDIDPLMPGEDFSALEKDCPGFFVELGAGSNGCTFPHHNSRYLMDEDALGYGIEYLVRLVRNRLS